MHHGAHWGKSLHRRAGRVPQILQQALQAARSFRPMTNEQVSALLAKTAQAARGGKYELYKTSHTFDGTYRNPQWLGPGSLGRAPAKGPQAP